MKKSLQHIPFFVFLLPVFFVLHGFQENYGFISARDSALLTLTYIAWTTVIYGLFYILLRNAVKAALLVTYLMAFYFFFAAVRDFLKQHLWVLHKYSVMLPVFLVSLIFLAVYLKKTRHSFYKAVLFINLLLIIYIFIDLAQIGWKSAHPYSNKFSNYSFNKTNLYTRCDSCAQPDIYFLLFDEYGSSLSLKEQFNYDNSDLDSFLVQRGFRIQTQSHSNYNITPFSMASILNMFYLTHVRHPEECTLDDYAACNAPIKENETLKLLSAQGYNIINYSIFDLAGNPSLVDQGVLPLKTNLISERTFIYNIKKDLGWMFNYLPKWMNYRGDLQILRNNDLFIDLVKKESSLKSSAPRFIYAHFNMPHVPFYYTRDGKLLDPPIQFSFNKSYIKGYLDYLPYTNSRVKELVTTIQQNTNGKAVIIFMGDHGLRPTQDKKSPHFQLQNQNAVYFPDKDYNLLYDSISGVNQFRVIFNKLFHQNFPLLKDSTVYLIDKK